MRNILSRHLIKVPASVLVRKLFLATVNNNQLQRANVLSLESLVSPQQFHSMVLGVVVLTLSVLALVSNGFVGCSLGFRPITRGDGMANQLQCRVSL